MPEEQDDRAVLAVLKTQMGQVLETVRLLRQEFREWREQGQALLHGLERRLDGVEREVRGCDFPRWKESTDADLDAVADRVTLAEGRIKILFYIGGIVVGIVAALLGDALKVWFGF